MPLRSQASDNSVTQLRQDLLKRHDLASASNVAWAHNSPMLLAAAHALLSHVQVSTNDCGLVMTEPMFNLPAIQRTTLEIVFEQFGFQSFFSAPAPEFAMHKWAADNPQDGVAQSLSGIVLDAGYSFTHAVPVFDGRAQCAAARRIRLGGKLLTNLMKEWVRPVPLPSVGVICDQCVSVCGARQHVLQASERSEGRTDRKTLLLKIKDWKDCALGTGELQEHQPEGRGASRRACERAGVLCGGQCKGRDGARVPNQA